ncbi:MAG: hypothetical protein ACT4O1_14585, partial [Gemmatimonadota bacterium]
LLRSPTTGTPNTLIVVINDVDARDASVLNTRVDPETEATPSTLGTIRWGAPDASGRVRVEWRKAITAC